MLKADCFINNHQIQIYSLTPTKQGEKNFKENYQLEEIAQIS